MSNSNPLASTTQKLEAGSWSLLLTFVGAKVDNSLQNLLRSFANSYAS